LEEEVLGFVYVQTPKFFEALIIDLLLAMGYASRRRDLASQIGQSHDGGVDGIIRQDPLGLDVILLRAKRLKPNSSVLASQVRDFIGTLSTRKATKGVFVTTGSFTGFAHSTIDQVQLRVKLIDGRLLSSLMVRHNLGVKPQQSFTYKQLDHSYFNSPQV
jgi:restriction system protein